MFAKHLIAIVVMIFLAACGPIYQTDYNFVAPQDEAGRQCSNNCLEKVQLCKRVCSLESDRCEQTARLQSENDYLLYVNERQKAGKPVERSRESFHSYASCGISSTCEEDCDATHRLCHKNCGGVVLERTYCTAFCE